MSSAPTIPSKKKGKPKIRLGQQVMNTPQFQAPAGMFKNTTSFIGSVVSILAMVIVSSFAVNHGYLEEVVPGIAPPQVQVDPKPAPEVAPAAVEMKLFGPAELLAGSEFFFHVDVSGGKAGVPSWTLVPPISNALTVFPDGKRARFQSNIPGKFALFVAVAGEGMGVSVDKIEFENLEVEEVPEEGPPENPMPPVAPVGPSPHQPSPMPGQIATVANLIQQAYNDVSSDDKQTEARAIAGSIKALIGRINSGSLPPSADPIAELESQVDIVLQDKSKHWGLFFAEMRAIITLLREQGDVTTIASTVPTLAEASAVLQSR